MEILSFQTLKLLVFFLEKEPFPNEKQVVLMFVISYLVTIHHIRNMAIQWHWIPAFAGMTVKNNSLL